jgi:polyisoprenoid-binding protein YceI
MAVMSQAEVKQLETPRPGRYRISQERSSITIATRHLFGLGAVRASVALRDGTISVADPVTDSVVRANAAVSTFRSGNEARDAAVLSSRLLHAEAHPSLTFTSTAFTSEAGEWRLRGELEARGVSRPVEARITGVSVTGDGGAFRVTARLSVDRYDFGITAYRGLAARLLTVDLDLYAETTSQSAGQAAARSAGQPAARSAVQPATQSAVQPTTQTTDKQERTGRS